MKPVPSFFELPRPTQHAAYALLGLVAFMIYDQYFWWQLQDEYAFGFIVPLFVAYVLYERWPRIGRMLVGTPPAVAPAGDVAGDAVALAAAGSATGEPPAAGPLPEPQPTTPGAVDRWLTPLLHACAVLMVGGGLISVLIGGLYRAAEGANLISSNFIAFGYVNILLGGVFVYGRQDATGRRMPLPDRVALTLLFLFPALIWMLSVPLFSAVYKTISTFLMNKVSIVVFQTFDVLGYAIVREGSVLKLPNGDVGVEDACSGIRSLTACLFAGSFLGAVSFESLWKKVFMVGTAMLFAFINNILRSLFLTAWAYGYGPEALNAHIEPFGIDLGNIHDFTGWVVLGLTVVCLLICVKLFSIQFEFDEHPVPPASPDESPAVNQ
jgi:exosortase